MLEDGRLRRKREVASRAVANGGDDLGAAFAGRRDNDGDVRKHLDRPSQSREVFHSGHACIEQHKIEIRHPGYTCQHLVDAVCGGDANILVKQYERSHQSRDTGCIRLRRELS